MRTTSCSTHVPRSCQAVYRPDRQLVWPPHLIHARGLSDRELQIAMKAIATEAIKRDFRAGSVLGTLFIYCSLAARGTRVVQGQAEGPSGTLRECYFTAWSKAEAG